MRPQLYKKDQEVSIDFHGTNGYLAGHTITARELPGYIKSAVDMGATRAEIHQAYVTIHRVPKVGAIKVDEHITRNLDRGDMLAIARQYSRAVRRTQVVAIAERK